MCAANSHFLSDTGKAAGAVSDHGSHLKLNQTPSPENYLEALNTVKPDA